MSIQAYHNRLGMVDANIILVDNAVSEYDERLFIDRHRETGDWVVMIKMERPNPPYPVLGFGPNLPPKHQVMQRLIESDAQRNDIRGEINKANALREKHIDDQRREAVGESAEIVEYLSRKEGHLPEYKSYRKAKRN